MRRNVSICLIAMLVVVVSFSTSRSAITAAGPLQVLAVVGGQPDDIAVDRDGRLVWGDIARGLVLRLRDGHVGVVARGISVPEGIVPLRNGTMLVAEQGRDRIVRVGRRGGVTPIYALHPVAGQEGVDGIGLTRNHRSLLIPDSPNGTVLSLSLTTHRARVLARGLGRPVDAAVDAQGNVLVPDEHLGTLAVISPSGRVTYRGSFNTPDDVAVSRNGTVWVTALGDNSLWALPPGKPPILVLTGLANPQGLTLDSCGDPIVVEQNAARIVRLARTPAARRCPL